MQRLVVCILPLFLVMAGGALRGQPEQQASKTLDSPYARLGAARPEPDVPRFEPSTCPIDVPDEPLVECGYLVVPEDYDQPEGVTIRLPVAIIRSPIPNAAPDPLLHTMGGPGWSSLSTLRYFANSPLVQDRDVIILEQRGNRFAEPSLACDVSIWWEERVGNTACLDSLLAQGIDLGQYTTANVVRDIGALQQTLGYDQWNLYGSSYSSKVMLLVMEAYPDAIRSVILASVLPPTETKYEHDPESVARALDVMFDDCAADPACAAAYPDLEAQLYRLLKRLNASPVSVDLRLKHWKDSFHTEVGEPIPLTVTGDELLGWVLLDSFYGPAYQPHTTAYLPLLVDQVDKGETELLYPWVYDQWESLLNNDYWSWGFYFSVLCQESLPAADRQVMAVQAEAFPELHGYIRHSAEISICEAWGLEPAPLRRAEPVRSDIPTLVLAGAYDPITPPAWSKATAGALSHSFYYEFPAAGHSVTNDNACAEEMMVAFLRDPAVDPDAGCLADLPNPEFVLPQEVIVLPGVFEIHYWEVGYTQAEQVLFFGCLILFLTYIVFLLVAGLMQLVRRDRHPTPANPVAHYGQPLAGLVAMLCFAFSFALRSALNRTAATARLLLRFGLPSGYWLLFMLLWVVVILTVVLVIVALVAWVRRYWSLPRRLLFTLVSLAAVAFASLAAYWGLLVSPL